MSYEFKFAGRSLSDLYGVTTKRPDIEVARYDGQRYTIPGKNGDEFRDNKRYLNVSMKRSIGFAQRPAGYIPDLVDQLINWLAYAHGYQEFEDTDHPGLITYAVLENFDSVRIQLRRYHFATLQFSRVPFWFKKTSVSESHYTKAEAASGVTLNNPYPLFSQPLIRIELDVFPTTSSPIIAVSLDSALLFYYEYSRAANDQSSFIIDTESLQAYIKKNTGEIQYVDADVSEKLIFKSGSTTLKLQNTANVYKLHVTPRWRCL